MWAIQTTMQVRDLSLKRKRERHRWVRAKAREWRRAGVEVVAFGNGQCAARGHRRIPTKQLMREIATIVPVLVIDEFGTSSRCADCKVWDKLNKETATQQVSQSGNNTINRDNRLKCVGIVVAGGDTTRSVSITLVT